MNKIQETQYLRRTQKDYTMSFKLQIVKEIEQGEISLHAATKKYGIQGRATIGEWIRKFGNFDRDYQIASKMEKSPEQKILELEQKVKLLEKQKAYLENQVSTADKKAIIFDMMIDIAEKEYNISIRKNSLPEQSTNIGNKKKER